MSKRITISEAKNGYIVETVSPYACESFVATTDKEMLDHVTKFFLGGTLDLPDVVLSQDLDQSPEQPEGTPASMPVEPMADAQMPKEEYEAMKREANEGIMRDFTEDGMPRINANLIPERDLL